MKKAGAAVGRYLGAGAVGSAKAVATGAAVYFGQKFVTSKAKFLQEHPMAGPIIMVAAGHLGKRRFPVAGTALIGAGTYAGALAYDLNQMATQPAAQQPAQAPAASSGTNALVDWGDTGALVMPDNIRALSAEDSGYSVSPSGMSIDSAMSL